MGYAQVRVHIWCHVAASQAPTHSRGMRPPPPQARPLLQQTATRHPRNSPPSQAFRLSKGGGGATGLPTTQGTTRPLPLSLPLPDEKDGDDVVHNDVDVLFPVWLLVVPLLLCYSELRHCMFIALFI